MKHRIVTAGVLIAALSTAGIARPTRGAAPATALEGRRATRASMTATTGRLTIITTTGSAIGRRGRGTPAGGSPIATTATTATGCATGMHGICGNRHAGIAG
ncbi:hypothetical protein [Salinicola tamaricis]|uniref:hypothetical protein n=1 Tax=Salinicola tamaricis TaxID=1771309 RepID=UPI001F5E0DE5|nr:hypothetical protein [Salinicola tamaricis]